MSPWAGACRGAPFALNGCINDALCLKHLLVKRSFGFRDEDIMLLTDDQPNPDRWPTRANMLYQMQMLVWDLRPGDSLFFSFSGMLHSLLQCSPCRAFLSAANWVRSCLLCALRAHARKQTPFTLLQGCSFYGESCLGFKAGPCRWQVMGKGTAGARSPSCTSSLPFSDPPGLVGPQAMQDLSTR